jgi:benzodiazapine receptor
MNSTRTDPPPRPSLLLLSGLLLLTLGIGAVGSIATIREIPTWYASLQKPSFNPPNQIFGPVWTTLYVLMSFSLWLIWNSTPSGPLSLRSHFLLVLALNAAWSPVFFGLHAMRSAATIIIAYAILLTALLVRLIRNRPLAGWIQLPHLIWILFATWLNLSLCKLNP